MQFGSVQIVKYAIVKPRGYVVMIAHILGQPRQFRLV